MTLAVIGCQQNTTHEQLGWRSKDFFDDPKVLQLCDAILANDLVSMQAAVDEGADINVKAPALCLRTLFWSRIGGQDIGSCAYRTFDVVPFSSPQPGGATYTRINYR